MIIAWAYSWRIVSDSSIAQPNNTFNKYGRAILEQYYVFWLGYSGESTGELLAEEELSY